MVSFERKILSLFISNSNVSILCISIYVFIRLFIVFQRDSMQNNFSKPTSEKAE